MTNLYKELPENVKVFLKRGILLLIGWLLFYHLLMKPANIPDRQLTEFTRYSTVKFTALFYPNTQERMMFDSATHAMVPVIYINNVPCVQISNPCNGLELYALYLGILFCIPAPFRRFIKYAISGLIVIYIFNILRCAGLAIMAYHQSNLVDFAHHYAFKLIIYAVAFVFWAMYSKKDATPDEPATAAV